MITRSQAKQIKAEMADHRILQWVRRFSEHGYSDAEREKDTLGAIAVAEIMAVEGESEHMKRILRTYMERITAGGMI